MDLQVGKVMGWWWVGRRVDGWMGGIMMDGKGRGGGDDGRFARGWMVVTVGGWIDGFIS